MADATNIIKYISLDNITLYDSLLKDYITKEDSKALKTVALSSDGKKFLFYTVSAPVGSTLPAFEIEIPETDLTGLVQKVITALSGNVPVFETGGGIKDSGVAITDLATKEFVTTTVAEEVLKTGHLSKQIVTVLPDAASAKENIIYMIKIESVTGADKYEEWIKIGSDLVLIGDTSTSLENYYTKEQVDTKIKTAKEEAITAATEAAATDAQSKADAALAEAKKYTDSEVKKVSDVASANAENITTLQGNLTTINLTLNAHEDRIKALESGMPDLATASADDIRALFA